MGFGFNLLMLIVIFPLTGILILLWIISRKAIFGKILGLIWSAILALLALAIILQLFTTKMKVKKQNIYGSYVIDKNKFPGEQANWQYENLKFKITKDNVMH